MALNKLLLFTFCGLFATALSIVDDTLMDDEDTLAQKGEFTFEMQSTLQCSDWQELEEVVEMRASILNAVVGAINGSCWCNFTRQHVELKDIECSSTVLNKMYFIGQISPVGSNVMNLSSLLGLVEDWGETGPLFEYQVLSLSITTHITIIGVDTEVIEDVGSGSGSGEEPTDFVSTTQMVTMVTNATTNTTVGETELPTSSAQAITSSLVAMVTVVFASILLF